MARKTRTSLLEDIAELTALLPWWAGVVLAFVAYFAFHALAVSELPAARSMHDMGNVFSASVWRAVGIFGQYLFPIVFLFGAAVSAIKRYRRRELVTNVGRAEDREALAGMTWREFETLVGEAFKLKGYTVSERGGSAADGGVDLVLKKASEKALVQCKQWRATKVPVQTVRELFGVMAAERATHGYVVTSGEFTADAQEFARGRNIELIDGARLFAMFDQVHDIARRSNAQPTEASPACPKCTKPMVKRIAKQGSNAGKAFWGCTSYPDCRGTRPV